MKKLYLHPLFLLMACRPLNEEVLTVASPQIVGVKLMHQTCTEGESCQSFPQTISMENTTKHELTAVALSPGSEESKQLFVAEIIRYFLPISQLSKNRDAILRNMQDIAQLQKKYGLVKEVAWPQEISWKEGNYELKQVADLSVFSQKFVLKVASQKTLNLSLGSREGVYVYGVTLELKYEENSEIKSTRYGFAFTPLAMVEEEKTWREMKADLRNYGWSISAISSLRQFGKTLKPAQIQKLETIGEVQVGEPVKIAFSVKSPSGFRAKTQSSLSSWYVVQGDIEKYEEENYVLWKPKRSADSGVFFSQWTVPGGWSYKVVRVRTAD